MSSGLVPRFPTLIVSGFCMLAALLSFVAGLTLDCQRKRARQAFEIQLNVLSLLLRQGRTGMSSGGNRPVPNNLSQMALYFKPLRRK